jgi:thyrotropin-releasing hormone receptor
VAIVFPIKAHILCTSQRTRVIISTVWLSSALCGLPTALYNTVQASPIGIEFCLIIFPDDHIGNCIIFKYLEASIFYFVPLLIQLTCYVVIGKHLFLGIDQLHNNLSATVQNGESTEMEKVSDTINARKGVIKMLVVCVTIYFLSYSPHQILLMYNTVSPAPFHLTWTFLVLVTTLAHINSAVNPILYCIFSGNFRRHFARILSCGKYGIVVSRRDTVTLYSNTEYTFLFRRSKHRQQRPPYYMNSV